MAPSGHPLSFSLGNAFTWAWNKFTQSWGAFVGALAVFLVVGAVIYGLFYLLLTTLGLFGSSGEVTIDPATGAYTYSGGSALTSGLVGSLLLSALFALVLAAYGYVVQAGVIRGALAVASAQPVEFKSFFATDRIGRIVGAGFLVALAVAIGSLLCYFPGLIIAFLTQYFMFFILDRDLGVVDSIKASYHFVVGNLGPLILIYLVSALIAIVGAALCGLGLLVAIPVIVLAQTFAYRTLQHQPIAP